MARGPQAASTRDQLTRAITWFWLMRRLTSAVPVAGLAWSSTEISWTGCPLIPPAALVASTQAWYAGGATMLDEAVGPVHEHTNPSTIGDFAAAPAPLGAAAEGRY